MRDSRSECDADFMRLIGFRTICPHCKQKTFEITMAYASAIKAGYASLHFECKAGNGCRAGDWKRVPWPEVDGEV